MKAIIRLALSVLGVVGALHPPIATAENLLQIYRLAVGSDPSYLAAAATRRSTLETLPIAASAYKPRVNFSASGSVSDQNIRRRYQEQSTGHTGYGNMSLTLNLTQPIYRLPLQIAIEQTDSLIRQADAVYNAAHQELMVRVSERYFEVLRSLDELDFARAELDAFKQQLNQSKLRFEVGLIAITDVEEAKAGFDLAQARLIASENGLDTANEALREVTGQYFTRLANLNEQMELTTPEPEDIDAWTEIGLQQNLSLEALRHQAEYRRREIDRIDAGRRPTLDLSGSYQINVSTGPITDGIHNHTANIGLTFNVPLYTGGEIESRVRQSMHRHQQALDQLEMERRRIQRMTRDAYLGIGAGRSRVRALEQAVRSATTAADAIAAGFQVGTRTSVDVLQARRELFRALRDLSTARYNFILDVLRLKQATGTLSDADLAAVNGWLVQ